MGTADAARAGTLSRRSGLLSALLLLSACQQSIEIGAAPEPAGGAPTNPPAITDLPPAADPPPSAGAAAVSGGGGAVSPEGAGGAAPEVPDVPEAGSLWHSDLESGDLSDFTAPGAATSGVNLHSATATVSSERAHSGSYAVKIELDAADGQDHLAELYRQIEPTPAYYGAWFFIDEMHAPAVYWTIFYFFAEKTAGLATTRQGMWDLNLNSSSVYFYDESSKQFVDASPKKPYPVGQWFHLEAYLNDANGGAALTVWLDGEQILQVSKLSMPPGGNVYWGIGSETDQLAPAHCTMYVDDATVSSVRAP
jgi:hypothetical protein